MTGKTNPSFVRQRLASEENFSNSIISILLKTDGYLMKGANGKKRKVNMAAIKTEIGIIVSYFQVFKTVYLFI